MSARPELRRILGGFCVRAYCGCVLPPRPVPQGAKGPNRALRPALPKPLAPVWPYPVRLRHLLFSTFLVTVGGIGIPKGRAAWETHDLATQVADYALCMVGPTGPQLVRNDLTAFQQMVRRRLVMASPEQAPFKNCAQLSEAVSGSPAVREAHLASAARFKEYGVTETRPDLSLDTLKVDLARLTDRAREAWPLVRATTELIRASLGAKEAIHPVAPPAPGVGRGLPIERALPKRGWRTANQLWVAFGDGPNRSVFRSTDQGATFRAVHRSGDDLPGGCGRESSFRLSSDEDGSLLVRTVDTENAVPVRAVHGEHSLLAVSCDERALVLAAQREGHSAIDVVLCSRGRRCAPLPLPPRRPFFPLTHASLDLARIGSATVVLVESGGIVRVISTRDDGRTWTPPSVAFDAGDPAPGVGMGRVPLALAPIGSRLFLYGTSNRSEGTYPLLVSDDQGASFRALDQTAPAPRTPPNAIARREIRRQEIAKSNRPTL